jgi:glutathione S-transferase
MNVTLTITAFERSPDRGKRLARDMPVRWALEEVGRPVNRRAMMITFWTVPAFWFNALQCLTASNAGAC